MVICYPTFPNYCLSFTWGSTNPGNWVFSVILSTVSGLGGYIFDTYKPILITFVDSKAVVLDTMYKYYFSLGHFCVIPVRQHDQCYQLCRYCVICCVIWQCPPHFYGMYPAGGTTKFKIRLYILTSLGLRVYKTLCFELFPAEIDGIGLQMENKSRKFFII